MRCCLMLKKNKCTINSDMLVLAVILQVVASAVAVLLVLKIFLMYSVKCLAVEDVVGRNVTTQPCVVMI